MDQILHTVGEIVNTHGIRGELKIVPHTDFAEERFAKGSKLVIVASNGAKTEVTVQSSRLNKKVYIILFKDFTNINEVEKFKGSLLKIDEKYQDDLEDDEYYYHEIIGCMVETEEGEQLGEIIEILSPGANDVWVINRPKNKQLLIPVIDDVVLEVDVANKKVIVSLMEGLLDE
ncbi:ribosome maturation factor RimM [Paenibacillus albiflavus]|uniref:Ribosome maturation factor RimM n=1 Tax=Paenibacillus albiflavus TaxID=2545760 RepID=A0A4R4EKE6_9BACL|nr:ribosome maturation factor RimM [Paenibacillus albiflavus]TCZ79933.1 ribosome maturation factor RimM [Paenibacillus albiflavus]